MPTSDPPKASDSKDYDNPIAAPEYPITADDVLFMVFTGMASDPDPNITDQSQNNSY